MTTGSVIRAKRLMNGDCIGVISPSWCGPAQFPHRFERGVKCLHELGYDVKTAKHALGQYGTYLAATPQERASDLMDMFLDDKVKAIIATIGGNHSCQLLPYLDFDVIRNHLKIFVGFSDITVLHLALWTQAGLVTFYGPTVMTEFADYPEMHPYTRDSFLRAVSGVSPMGQLSCSDTWTDEFLDWSEKLDLTRPRQL
ncbi:MAG: LD-carboxypeptidase, partial [Planctomycetaceae bacterium]|nr:LD-carboxypeptidase [Planctomycetaceae bacterium]